MWIVDGDVSDSLVYLDSRTLTYACYASSTHNSLLGIKVKVNRYRYDSWIFLLQSNGINIAKNIYTFMTYENSPEIKSFQTQILYGTIIGGSSIVNPTYGRNCYLAMRDSDLNWLSYKINELQDMFKMDSNTVKKDKNTYRCYSIAYPCFNSIYRKFYKDGKKIITKEILESLNDLAWMVWYVDSGRKSKRKVYLRTQKFGEEGTQIIADYFNSLDCTCSIKKQKERFEIVFDNKGAQEYLKTFAHRIPNFLAKD